MWHGRHSTSIFSGRLSNVSSFLWCLTRLFFAPHLSHCLIIGNFLCALLLPDSFLASLPFQLGFFLPLTALLALGYFFPVLEALTFLRHSLSWFAIFMREEVNDVFTLHPILDSSFAARCRSGLEYLSGNGVVHESWSFRYRVDAGKKLHSHNLAKRVRLVFVYHPMHVAKTNRAIATKGIHLEELRSERFSRISRPWFVMPSKVYI